MSDKGRALSDQRSTWQDAMRGVPVFAGALVREEYGSDWTVPIRALYPVEGGESWVCGPNLPGQQETMIIPASHLILDMADSDTMRSFDARLALHLGAPAEAVKTGTMLWFFSSDGYFRMWAGMRTPRGYQGRGRAGPAWMFTTVLDAADERAARGLAWVCRDGVATHGDS